jgi:hypothetical protein
MASEVSSWLENDDLRRLSFPTVILENPPKEFFDYLQQDTIILSEELPTYCRCEYILDYSFSRSLIEDESIGDEAEDAGDEDEDALLFGPEKLFPEFHQKLKATIESLGKFVFPKLGTLSPKVNFLF